MFFRYLFLCAMFFSSSVVLSLPHFTNSPYLEDERSICGENNIKNLWYENETLQTLSRPVGRLKVTYEEYAFYCTGTLISSDLFLTAGHCLDRCSRTTVEFGYMESDENETFDCKEILDYGSSNQDFMVIRLKGSPGVNWGWIPIANEIPEEEDELLMLHHPSGDPLRVSKEDCHFVEHNWGLIHHTCDTETGSSGAAILRPDWDEPKNTRVIGVHAFGGCHEPGEANSGPAIRDLLEISPTLEALLL